MPAGLVGLRSWSSFRPTQPSRHKSSLASTWRARTPSSDVVENHSLVNTGWKLKGGSFSVPPAPSLHPERRREPGKLSCRQMWRFAATWEMRSVAAWRAPGTKRGASCRQWSEQTEAATPPPTRPPVSRQTGRLRPRAPSCPWSDALWARVEETSTRQMASRGGWEGVQSGRVGRAPGGPPGPARTCGLAPSSHAPSLSPSCLPPSPRAACL